MNARNILFVLLLFASGACHSESEGKNAVIPYAIFYKLATAQFNEADLKSKKVSFVFYGGQPDVKIQDITIYIDEKNGRILIPLNSDGLGSLPLSKDLLEENPYVLTNQPKGTMKFDAKIEFNLNKKASSDIAVNVPENLELRYVDIFKSKHAFKNIFNIFSDASKETYPEHLNENATWIEFKSAKLARSPVVIHSKGGDINANPDDDGVIRITYEPKLSEENPMVSFPDRGTVIVRSNAVTR